MVADWVSKASGPDQCLCTLGEVIGWSYRSGGALSSF